MPPTLPIQLDNGEIVLKEESIWHIRTSPMGFGYIPVDIYAWLTSQRLILRRSLGSDVRAYPLSHVSGARIQEVGMRIGGVGYATPHKVLRIEFDNGGQEALIPANAQEWMDAILSARSSAPVLPYSTQPPLKSPLDGSAAGTIFVIAVLGAVICVCLVVAAVIGPMLLLAVSGGGS